MFLSAVFVFTLGWLPGVSTLTGFRANELVLPTAVLTLTACGYIARMTRASMAETMRAPLRPHRPAQGRLAAADRVPPRAEERHGHAGDGDHAAGALAALGRHRDRGVLRLPGFGTLLYQASVNGDIYLIEACAMISVMVVVASQLVSDAITAG